MARPKGLAADRIAPCKFNDLHRSDQCMLCTTLCMLKGP